MTEYKKIAEQNYDLAKRTLESMELMADTVPSLPEVQKALQKLTAEQIEVIEQMEKPTLLLLPPATGKRYIRGFNKLKPFANQQDAYIDDFAKTNLNRSQSKWQIAIHEAAEVPKDLKGDDTTRSFGERLKWFAEKYHKNGVTSGNYRTSMMLYAHGMKQTPPVKMDDWRTKNVYSLLSGEDFSRSAAVSDWGENDGRFYFDEYSLNAQHVKARFRCSVMVEV